MITNLCPPTLTDAMQQKEQSKHGRTTSQPDLPHATLTFLSPNGIAYVNKPTSLSTSSDLQDASLSFPHTHASMEISISIEAR